MSPRREVGRFEDEPTQSIETSREAVGREREPVNLPSFFDPKRRLSSFLSSGGEVAFGMQNTHRLLGEFGNVIGFG